MSPGSGTRDRLIEVDDSGVQVATIDVPGSYKIQDATFDSDGDIYVSDRGTGTGTSHKVRIVKLAGGLVDGGPAKGTVLAVTQTVLPPSIISYPLYPLYSMLEYQASTHRLIARINTATFAVMNPDDLSIGSYRFSGDTAHTAMTLNTSDDSDITLYTAGSGFNLPSFFGKQSGFLNNDKYLDSEIYRSPEHDWKISPTMAPLDVSVDSNDYVYTIQHNGTVTRVYVYDEDAQGQPYFVKQVDLPSGTKIAVVR